MPTVANNTRDKLMSRKRLPIRLGGGDSRITGLMIESHLREGRQDKVEGKALERGVSVTDACISTAQTAPVLQSLAMAVRRRRTLAR